MRLNWLKIYAMKRKRGSEIKVHYGRTHTMLEVWALNVSFAY
jgi:hypothetical protein